MYVLMEPCPFDKNYEIIGKTIKVRLSNYNRDKEILDFA